MQTLFSYLLICVGIFFMIASTIGMIRFDKDKLMKIHAIGITDVVAIPAIAIGFLIENFSFMLIPKVMLLLLMLLVTSSTSSYIAARLIYHDH